MRALPIKICLMTAMALGVAEASFAQILAPQRINLQGRLVRSDGVPVTNNGVSFTLQVRSSGTESCLLYEETHVIDMSSSDGIFSIKLGSGARSGVGFDGTSALRDVFNNSSGPVTSLSCATGSVYSPASGDTRSLRISFNEGTGLQTLAQDQIIQSVPYAMHADSLQGKTPSNFVQTISALESTPGTTQTRVNQIIDTDWAGLNALLAGTSTLYAKAVPTGAVDYNNQRIVYVANPTSPQDAATKDYSDTKIGGNAAVVGVLAPGDAGKALTWDGTKWVAQTVSTTDATKLPLAGGTMTGAINMGAQNITNAGHIQLGLQKTLLLGRYDNTQETALVSTLLAADNGRVWFNTDTSKQRLWNGTAAVDVGSSTLVVGTTAGTAMGADAVPNCTAAQKLQMSLGPTYSWTCVTDTATQWTTAGADIYFNTGNVGIGTTTPVSALDVAGGIRFGTNSDTCDTAHKNEMRVASNGLQIEFCDGVGWNLVAMQNYKGNFAAGTSAAPGISFNSDYNSGLWNPSYGALGISTNSTERIRITSAGNVGIGTTSPVNRLHVVGDQTITSTHGASWPVALTIQETSSTGIAGIAFNDNGSSNRLVMGYGNQYSSTGYTAFMQTDSATPIVFRPNGSESVRLATNGNVGIGITSPSAVLNLKAGTAAAGTAPFKLTAGTNLTTPEAGAIEFDGTNLYYTNAANARQTIATSAGGSQWTTSGSDIYYSTGRVGVGTSSPGAKFEVSDAATETMRVVSSTSDAGISINGSGSTLGHQGVFVNSGDIYLKTGNAERFRVTSAGSSSFSGRAMVTSADTFGFSVGRNGSTNPAFNVDTNTVSSATGLNVSGNVAGSGVTLNAISSGTNENFAVTSKGTGHLLLNPAGTGNVGIGTTTPSARLHVTGGNAMIDGSSVPALSLMTDNNAGGNSALNFFGGANVADSIVGASYYTNFDSGWVGATVASVEVRRGSTADAGYLKLGTRPAGGTSTERLRITESGNVGIGTTTPSAGLDVLSTRGFRVSGGVTPVYPTAGYGFEIMWDADGKIGANSGGSGVAVFQSYSRDASAWRDLWFRGAAIGFDTSNTERMRIDTTGNVGIGTSAPTYKLDVNGDIRIATASKLYIGGTAVCDNTGCPSPSDRRYKKNVVPLENSLENILKIQGVSYDWIDSQAFNDKHQIGFIAQELEKVYPEVVKTDDKTGFKSVMYDKLVAPLIEAFKTLNSRVQGLESKQLTHASELALLKAQSADKDHKIGELEKENAEIKIRLKKIEKILNLK